MKLTSVEISNYKCIRKPCRIDILDITCLVGKNESGKTAILEAIYRLNPIIPEHDSFNMDDDFPRMDVEDYRLELKSGKIKPAIVTRATFSLEQGDKAKIEKDFPAALAGPELILSKGYDNELYAELTVNEENTVEALLKKASLEPEILKSLVQLTTIKELESSLKEHKKSESVSKLLTLISEIQKTGLLRFLYERYFESRVPKFLYFDEFYQMKGHVNIEALIERKRNNQLLDSDYPLLGLIDLARLNLDEITNPKRALERNNRLEGASNHLTRRVMKYWSQNRFLEMRFDIRPALPEDPEGMKTGTNLWSHVYNTKHKASTLLGKRSKGFVWFFSFLAWFSQQKQTKTPLILLLDEPALFLHGTAQRDLLRYLEDEKTTHQVIYTTQSPYMIDPRHFDRIRIVEDKSMETDQPLPDCKEGTQVDVNVLNASKESILPLQGAMGYELCQSLLPDHNVLIVDGVQDILYIKVISGLLEANNRIGIDPNWTIVPLGGSKKLPAFISLMDYKDSRNIACLLDTNEQEETLENLYKKKLLQKENFYIYADFVDLAEADIEDIFEVDFYLALVNSEYKDVLSKPITKGNLKGRSMRITRLIKESFESTPLQNNIKFNRYRPARFFTENSSSLREEISKETFNRFEKIFKMINSLLK